MDWQEHHAVQYFYDHVHQERYKENPFLMVPNLFMG